MIVNRRRSTSNLQHGHVPRAFSSVIQRLVGFWKTLYQLLFILQKKTCDKRLEHCVHTDSHCLHFIRIILFKGNHFCLQRLSMGRRAFSDGESSDRSECCCKQNGKLGSEPSNQSRIFPSLTDNRMHEFGIANLSETDLNGK